VKNCRLSSTLVKTSCSMYRQTRPEMRLAFINRVRVISQDVHAILVDSPLYRSDMQPGCKPVAIPFIRLSFMMKDCKSAVSLSLSLSLSLSHLLFHLVSQLRRMFCIRSRTMIAHEIDISHPFSILSRGTRYSVGKESSVISESRWLVTRRVNISLGMTFSAYRWLAVAANVALKLSTR